MIASSSNDDSAENDMERMPTFEKHPLSARSPTDETKLEHNQDCIFDTFRASLNVTIASPIQVRIQSLQVPQCICFAA